MKIVIITNNKSIFIALLFKYFWFLFKYIEKRYCTKLIIFELTILNKLLSMNPIEAEKAVVNSSGIEVAIPVIFPRCFRSKVQ